MKRSPAFRAAITVAAICLLLFAVSIGLLSGGRRWMSDPTAVRPTSVRLQGVAPWSDYAVIMADPGPAPAVDSRLFDSFSITTNEAAVTVVYPSAAQPRDDVAGHTVHRVGPDQRFEINDGAIALKYVGVAYDRFPPDKETGTSSKLTGRFFRASDLAELSGEDFEREIPNDRNREMQFMGRFPAVQFSFALERLQEGKDFLALDIAAYDARTHRRITAGGFLGNKRNPSERNLNLDLRVWHQTPVDIVLTVAHGPFEVLRFEPKVGAKLRHARGELKLITIANGRSTGGSGSGSGNSRTDQVRIDQPAGKKWTTFVFANLTSGRSLPLGFGFFDAADSQLPSEGGLGFGGVIRAASFAGSADNVSRIDAKLYRHIQRLVFRLPEIPGMPPENRQVQNLFDVKIPYVRVRADYELWNLLEDTLQMRVTRPKSAPKQPHLYPQRFANVTAADLLREYRKHFPTWDVVQVDSQKHQIEFKPHPVMELWNRARKFVTGKK